MKRKKNQGRSAIAGLVLLAVALALGYGAWRHRASFQSLFPEKPAPVVEDAGSAAKQQLHGKLQVLKQPRDPDLGITVPEVALLRNVSMYQWQEHCNGDDCSYALAWSAQHIDSTKFHSPAGHENKRPPFFNARFFAGELRLGDVAIDPAILTEQHAPVDYPIDSAALPPNLAATFSVVDGLLYAGGDPAHPTAGMLRIAYRIIPAGEVDLAGVRRGNRLEAQ
jgi:transmembrane protein TMEM43